VRLHGRRLPSVPDDEAFSDGLVPRNAADVKAPQPTPEKMRPLSEEALALMEAPSGKRFEALYALAITTRLRHGELLGGRYRHRQHLQRGR
jgi:integrase